MYLKNISYMNKTKITKNESFLTSLSGIINSISDMFSGNNSYTLGQLKRADIEFEGRHYSARSKMLGGGHTSECYELILSDEKNRNKERLVLKKLTDNFVSSYPQFANLLEQEYNLFKELNLEECRYLTKIEDYIESEKCGIYKYTPGWTLDEFVVVKQPYFFKRSTTIKFCNQLLDTLDFLHKKGLCHLDICPDNILIKADGTYDMQLLNLGIAPAYYNKIPIGNGYGDFCPPELKKEVANVTPKSDIWQFGTVLKLIIETRRHDPTRASNHLKRIAIKCTQEDPAKRYDNVLEIKRDIAEWQHLYDNFGIAPKPD